MKAYLYPDLFGFGYDNDVWNGDMACRVEVELLAVPQKGDMIWCDCFGMKVANNLFENCKKQLLHMNSVIYKIIDRVRRDIREGNEGYVMDAKKEYADLPNIELLRKIILEYSIKGFSEGIWYVRDVNMLANDDHLHITIYQEI